MPVRGAFRLAFGELFHTRKHAVHRYLTGPKFLKQFPVLAGPCAHVTEPIICGQPHERHSSFLEGPCGVQRVFHEHPGTVAGVRYDYVVVRCGCPENFEDVGHTFVMLLVRKVVLDLGTIVKHVLRVIVDAPAENNGKTTSVCHVSISGDAVGVVRPGSVTPPSIGRVDPELVVVF